MRRRSSLAIVWLIPLVLSLIITGTYSSFSAEAAEQVGNSPPPSRVDISARIARVESGLLPPVLIQGEPTPVMTLAARMPHYNIPGVSIAVINTGEIEWARGYGVRERGGNVPVTTTTLFQAGSISKPVAAMAALFLVQQGKLELDEPVNTKLVSWKLPQNEYTTEQKVSLRGILSHTAGLTVRGFPGYAVNAEIPTLLQVLDERQPATRPNASDPPLQYRCKGREVGGRKPRPHSVHGREIGDIQVL